MTTPVRDATIPSPVPHGAQASDLSVTHAPVRETFLPFSPPSISAEEIAEVVAALQSDWITTGPRTQEFGAAFARFVHAPAALPLSSCTAGLHTALLTLGIHDGDEVITTPMTFAASANVIEHVRATPVFADVEPDTLNIDPEQVARRITARTRAIIAVHYAGHPAELDALRALAAQHHLTIIEDAAHSFPASYRGTPIGAGTNPVAFSFYATKNLTTGEGGMLTGDEEFLDRARVLSLHGLSRDAWKRYAKGGSWRYDVVAPGFKYNMTDIQAALGLVQLRRIPGFQERRRQVVDAYRAGLGDLEALELPAERPHVGHAWHLFMIRLRPGCLTIDRDAFIERMTSLNIATSVHFIPVHLHPWYRDRYALAPDAFPVANDAFNRMLSLPLHPRLSNADVADVIDAVRRIVRDCAR